MESAENMKRLSLTCTANQPIIIEDTIIVNIMTIVDKLIFLHISIPEGMKIYGDAKFEKNLHPPENGFGVVLIELSFNNKITIDHRISLYITKGSNRKQVRINFHVPQTSVIKQSEIS